MANPDVMKTLDESVAEVLGLLTGTNLEYLPEYDKYQSIVRFLNQALRRNALEAEWSYYSSNETIGTAQAGRKTYQFRATLRPRIITDDAVLLINAEGDPVVWAYILPREAIHKNQHRDGLWAAVTKNTLTFSRPLTRGEEGLKIQLPVMREPKLFEQFDLPASTPTPVSYPQAAREQLLDFDFPDVVIARAAYLAALADPMFQPRAQTLEAEFKDIMYQLIERDQRHTDSPYENTFLVPISNSIYGSDFGGRHGHPHAEGRGFY